MDAIFDKAAQVIDRYGGRIASLLGDGVMAVFGDPVSHEDDAIRAVRAVNELHDAVDAMSPGIERRIGRPVRMHSGESPSKGTQARARPASSRSSAERVQAGSDGSKDGRTHLATPRHSPP